MRLFFRCASSRLVSQNAKAEHRTWGETRKRVSDIAFAALRRNSYPDLIKENIFGGKTLRLALLEVPKLEWVASEELRDLCARAWTSCNARRAGGSQS
jgi:hypothetical protein